MLTHLGSFNLGQVNIGLLAAMGFLNPLCLQLDLFLTGAFGLGPFLADLQVQFNAAIAAQANIALNLTNPFAGAQALLAAFAQITAALQVVMALGVPSINLQLSAQLAAIVALMATLQVKIGGIKALIAGGLAIKIPALQFIGQVAGTLNAGPVHLYSFTDNSLSNTGLEIASEFAAGIGPSDPIFPTDTALGLLLVTKDPIVFSAMGVILKTS